MHLSNKSALITGATSSLGDAIARMFHSQNVDLILVDKYEELLEKQANELKAKHYVCDVEKVDQIRQMCVVVREEYENLDILVNNATVGYYNDFKDVTLEEWERSYAVNVRAPFLLTKELLSILDNGSGGQIINIGVDCGEEIIEGKSVFYSNKHALRAWSLAVSREFEGTNLNNLHFCLGSNFSYLVPVASEHKDPNQIKTILGMSPNFVAENLVKVLQGDNLNTEVTLIDKKPAN